MTGHGACTMSRRTDQSDAPPSKRLVDHMTQDSKACPCCCDLSSSCLMMAGARGSEAIQRPGRALKLTCVFESSCVGAHGGPCDTCLQNGKSASRPQQVRLRQCIMCLLGKLMFKCYPSASVQMPESYIKPKEHLSHVVLCNNSLLLCLALVYGQVLPSLRLQKLQVLMCYHHVLVD